MPVRFLSSEEETKLQQSKEEYQPKFEAFGRPAPTPFADENNDEFRRRALAKLQPLVPGFEDLKIDAYLREPNFKYGKHYDLFGGPVDDPFRWCVAIFVANGATQIIQRANAVPLATYYPIFINEAGEYVPVFRNYLFIEFKESSTYKLCHSSLNFVRMITAREVEKDIYKPILVRRDAIKESAELLRQGRFNELEVRRRFYGRGSRVLVKDGNFSGKLVTIQIDIKPSMGGKVSVPVDINGHRATIELFKLAL